MSSMADQRILSFETVAAMFQTLPSLLRNTNYKNPDDSMHTVFQDAWDIFCVAVRLPRQVHSLQ